MGWPSQFFPRPIPRASFRCAHRTRPCPNWVGPTITINRSPQESANCRRRKRLPARSNRRRCLAARPICPCATPGTPVSLRRESVTLIFGEQRRAAGTVIEPVRINESAGVGVTLLGWFSDGGFERFNNFLIAQPMVQDQPIASNRWRAVTRADLFLPNERWSISRPGVRQTGFALKFR